MVTDEDVKKAEILKAELQKVIDYFHECEEATEHREQEVPLGVPLDDKMLAHHFGAYEFGFSSEESFRVFHGRLKDFVEALQKLAKGEPIDIQVLLPLLKKGWVAYEKDCGWVWFKNKPFILRGTEEDETWCNEGSYGIIGGFNLKPAENWETSLMECGL